MYRYRNVSKGDKPFLIIACLIMGTVFILGMRFWNAPITQEEAIHTTAVFSSYTERRSRGNITEIIIHFDDQEQRYIDGSCINNELREAIHTLVPGTQVSMIVHPNSNTIMDLKAGNTVLLEFQTTAEALAGDAAGFTALGGFCYILAVCGCLSLLFKKE